MVKLSALVLLGLWPAAALAAGDEGRAAFERGRQLYLAGDYQEALPHLQDAYEQSGRRPSTILALGKCRRALGDTEGALLLYQDYLAIKPPPSDAAKVQLEVEELRAERRRDQDPEQDFLDQQRRPAPTAPPEWQEQAFAPPPPEPALLERPWFWISVAAVIAGGVVLTVALSSGAEEPLGGTLGVVVPR